MKNEEGWVPLPPFVVDEADRKRWELCEGIAAQIFDDAPGRWYAARALFQCEIPTEDVQE